MRDRRETNPVAYKSKNGKEAKVFDALDYLEDVYF
jgi:hypothetical protein